METIAVTRVLPMLTLAAPASPAPTRGSPTVTPTLSPLNGATNTPPDVSFGTPIRDFPPGRVLTFAEIEMIDASTGWAIGGYPEDRSHVFRTVDAGQTWTEVTPPQPTEEGSYGLAVTFFLSSEDSWAVRVPDAPPFDLVTVWHTQDGGQTWQGATLSLEGQATFPRSLYFVDPQTGWLLTGLPPETVTSSASVEVYRTRNGGESWEQVTQPVMIALDDGSGSCIQQETYLRFIDADRGWFLSSCTVNGSRWLLRTDDGGSSWTTVDLPMTPEMLDPSLFTDCFPNSPPVLFSPQAGAFSVTCWTADDWLGAYVYVTADGGQSWDLRKFPYPSAFELPSPSNELLDRTDHVMFIDSSVAFASSTDLYLFSNGPTTRLYQTLNGGRSWTKIKTVSWEGELNFLSQNLGWAAASSWDEATGEQTYALVKTTDGGRSWQQLEPYVSLAGNDGQQPDVILKAGDSKVFELRQDQILDVGVVLSPEGGDFVTFENLTREDVVLFGEEGSDPMWSGEVTLYADEFGELAVQHYDPGRFILRLVSPESAKLSISVRVYEP